MLLPRATSAAVPGVEDDGSLAFAQRFGFVETDRQLEQVHLRRTTKVPGQADRLSVRATPLETS
jgi:hypothetical protein